MGACMRPYTTVVAGAPEVGGRGGIATSENSCLRCIFAKLEETRVSPPPVPQHFRRPCVVGVAFDSRTASAQFYA